MSLGCSFLPRGSPEHHENPFISTTVHSGGAGMETHIMAEKYGGQVLGPEHKHQVLGDPTIFIVTGSYRDAYSLCPF